MQGQSALSSQKLTEIKGTIERFTAPPNLYLKNLFGEDKWESDNIEWESEIGNRGLAPFASPDGPAEQTSIDGTGKNAAAAAFWKEKMFMSEAFLNNLRMPGTSAEHQRAERTLAKGLRKLSNRNMRRKEWMLAKMLEAGTFTYVDPKGMKTSVTYGIPSENQSTLATNRKWSTGTSRNIMEDIMDVRITVQKNYGISLNRAMCTSEVLKYMLLDPGLQTVLAKSAFGNGDLLANPTRVLASLLGFSEIVVYDEMYQIIAWLTAAVTGSSTTTVSVDDARDFAAGAQLTFVDVSAGTHERETISSVSETGSTVTVSTAPAASFKAEEDYVYMNKKFLSDTKFIMFTDMVEGSPIAKFANAPHGLARSYGVKVDTWEVKDPDGIYLRVEDKGLPVLYHEDAVYQLTVA